MTDPTNVPEYMYRAEVIRVVDGDTIDVRIDLGFELSAVERIRLRNVDTAEIYGVKRESEEYERGMVHKRFVESWTNNPPLVLLSEDYDRGKYGRVIGDLYSLKTDTWLTEDLKRTFDDV